MALSNAERQRQFRERRNAAAKGSDLGQRARDAMDAAIAVIWDVVHRPDDEGRTCADADDFADLAAYRAYWAKQADAAETRAGLAVYSELSTDAEQAVIRRAIEVLDAALLTHIEVPKSEPKKRR